MAPHTWSRPKRHTPRALPGLNCSRRCSLPWKGVLTSQPFISDGPMPDYVSSIQTRSKEGESQTITTQVRATISTYNNTTEIFRDHSSWWDQYIEFDSGIIITTIDLYTNGSIGLPVNNFNVESWRQVFVVSCHRPFLARQPTHLGHIFVLGVGFQHSSGPLRRQLGCLKGYGSAR